MTSIFGGIVAAEALKLTGKFTPIDQWYGYDQVKFIPALEESKNNLDARYNDNIQVIGAAAQEALSKMNVFLPGIGAIGCEVLKCLACLGVGLEKAGGKTTIVDYDKLEVSNLNRQFLFTDKDRRKYKVKVAKKKILEINQDMGIKEINKKLGLHTMVTAVKFPFWDSLDICINGLDNITGRVYCDIKCIEHEIPFLESGTEGQMAHTSVIIPYKTNTYTDYTIKEPKEDKKERIPFCTLRNQPHTIHHCTEWAISKFGDFFTYGLKDVKILLDTTLSQKDLTVGQITSLIKFLDWL